MALQTIKGGLWVPAPMPYAADRYVFLDSAALNDADDKVATIFQVPKAGTINQIGFRTGTVTTGDTLAIRLETVSVTTGAPSGTLYGGSTAITQAIADTGDNTWFTVTLGTGATAVKGDVIAVVIQFNSWVAGNLTLARVNATSASARNQFPYFSFFETAWVHAGTAGTLALAIQYSDNSVEYLNGIYPIKTITNNTFANNSTPDEYALKFQMPFPARLAGFSILGQGSSSGPMDIVLYDSNGTTALVTTTINDDQQATTAANIPMIWSLSATQTLLKSTYYYLSIKPTSTSTVPLQVWSVNTAAFLDQMEGGQLFHLATRTDAGAWTAATTDRPQIYLLFDQFDDGVSAGGGGVIASSLIAGG